MSYRFVDSFQAGMVYELNLLEPSGPLQACNEDCFCFTLLHEIRSRRSLSCAVSSHRKGKRCNSVVRSSLDI